MTPIPTPPVRVPFADFHLAMSAALSAGWSEQAAHDAVCCMLASGVAASQIVWLFLDCKKRIQ